MSYGASVSAALLLVLAAVGPTASAPPRTAPLRKKSSAQALQPGAERLARGARLAANASLLVAGLVRNAASTLPKLRARLARLGSRFAAWRAIVVENDSADNTLEYLRAWARAASRASRAGGAGAGADASTGSGRGADSRGADVREASSVKVISESLAADPSVGPYARRSELKARGWGHDGVKLLARLRNRYLDVARAELIVEHAAAPPFLLMVDFDVGDDWDDDAVLAAIGHETKWDVQGRPPLRRLRLARQAPAALRARRL